MAGPIKPSKKIEKPVAGKAAIPPAAPSAKQGSTAVAAVLAADPAKVAVSPPATANSGDAPAQAAVPAKAVETVRQVVEAVVPSTAKPAAPAKPVAAPAAAPAVPPQPVAAVPQPRKPAPPKAKPAQIDASSPLPNDKGPIAMATAADTFTTAASTATDKAQGMFADAQSRSKAAWEKGARFYEELGAFAKGNVEALIASSKVATGALETMGQDAVAYGRKSAEDMTAAAKSMAAVKSPTELFQLQSDFARKAIDDYVAESAKVSEKLVKLATDMSQPLSSRFALAAEKVKSASL